MLLPPPSSTLFPYTTLFRSCHGGADEIRISMAPRDAPLGWTPTQMPCVGWVDRKSTRLNSSHANISYAVFCLKKKKKINAFVKEGQIRSGFRNQVPLNTSCV